MITTAQSSRDQFLELLVAQIRHQDPLEPVSQEQFIAQLAQFSTLEGIEQMNGNFELMLQANQSARRVSDLSQGSAMIGRSIDYYGVDGPAAGVVEAVEAEPDSVSVIVNGESVSLDRIQRLTA